MKKLRVLIVAYACSPVQGSEPGMGWQFVRQIAKTHEVWVIVEKKKFRDEIETALENNPKLRENMHFHFITKKRNKPLRKIWPPSYYWYYRKWHKQAFYLARKLNREHDFDLVHQLNMVGFREPGYLWKLNKPFVWGPVGGFNQFPLQMLGSLDTHGMIHQLGRNILNAIQQRTLLRPEYAAKKAGKGLISATSAGSDRMKKIWGVDSSVICEVGTLESEGVPTSRKESQPLRLIWSGLNIPRKALPLLLEALHKVETNPDSKVEWKLDVLGDGPLANKWRQKAKDFGINNHCVCCST